MLWYKNWLETRWRLAFAVAIYSAELILMRGRVIAATNLVIALGGLSFLWIFSSVMFAGTGIKTQSAGLSTMKGLHGSTYFTLSLPVSRSTLFGVRTILGLTQLGLTVVIVHVALWADIPILRAGTTATDALRYGLATFACCLVFYCLSALLAVYLDSSWQLYGSMLAIGGSWWLTRNFQSDFNLFRVLREGNPLLTHRIPWPAMTISFAISAILLVVTLKVIQTQEF